MNKEKGILQTVSERILTGQALLPFSKMVYIGSEKATQRREVGISSVTDS